MIKAVCPECKGEWFTKVIGMHYSPLGGGPYEHGCMLLCAGCNKLFRYKGALERHVEPSTNIKVRSDWGDDECRED